MKLLLRFAGKRRRAVLFLFDFLCFAILNVAYFWISRIAKTGGTEYEVGKYLINAGLMFVMMFGLRLIFGIYSNIWRYTSTQALLMLVISDMIGAFFALLTSYLVGTYSGLWHFLDVAALTLIIALTSRFVYRLIYKYLNMSNGEHSEQNVKKVAIFGAGQLGALLLNELQCDKKTRYKPMFFIDRDETKIGSTFAGLRVYPEGIKSMDMLRNLDISEIFIAIANLDSDKLSQIFDMYRHTGCKLKLYDSHMKDADETGKETKYEIRDFDIEDLLFRKPISINGQKAFSYYSDKVILVTGGGGSIGSELCRQIAKCHPKKLIIFDIYENNAYEIQQELIRNYGDGLDLSVEIGSVRDRDRLDAVFAAYRPQVVFHAAAHKHVPLMEHSGCEAIKNNIFGTYNTADMAEKYGVEKFILVSTDKAVNPTNLMGASKRMCEMVIQCRTDSKTSFAAVRFGNVLGSNGSVIPLFKKQIAQGGPVTITDKRIIRYFMTIPEASQLVMQAGAMAKRGELFVLDMGKPVRIYDLAVNMIRLSGFEPETEIQIEEIGLRPGEKLFEELLMKTEKLQKTDNNKIFVEKDTPLTRDAVEAKLADLRAAVEETKAEIASPRIQAAIAAAVPTYRTPEEVNKNAEQSEEMKKTVAYV